MRVLVSKAYLLKTKRRTLTHPNVLGMLKMGRNVLHGASCCVSVLCLADSRLQHVSQAPLARICLHARVETSKACDHQARKMSPIAREKPAFYSTGVNGTWNQFSQRSWRGIRSILRWPFWKKRMHLVIFLGTVQAQNVPQIKEDGVVHPRLWLCFSKWA